MHTARFQQLSPQFICPFSRFDSGIRDLVGEYVRGSSVLVLLHVFVGHALAVASDDVLMGDHLSLSEEVDVLLH